MKLFRGIDSYSCERGAVVTVGSFDGLHSGHNSLIELLKSSSREANLESVVVSFSPHPRVTLGRAEGLRLLTSDSEKEHLLGRAGIDSLLLLEFNSTLSLLSYEEFVVEYLIKRVNMVELIVGFNHHMGHNGGDYRALTQLASKHNFKVTLAHEYGKGDQISSSSIRKLIESGEIKDANRLLSHKYPIFGSTTSAGELIIENPLKLIPPEGSYRALIDGEQQAVTIDSLRRVWCSVKDKRVEIKLEDRL